MGKVRSERLVGVPQKRTQMMWEAGKDPDG